MIPQEMPNDSADTFFCWRSVAYGAPDATSEVNRIIDFYRVDCLTAFGSCQCGEGVGPEAALAA